VRAYGEVSAIKALVWEAPKEMRIRELPKPVAQQGWAVLDVKRVGICGSDIAGFLGKNDLRKPPLVMGHELSGVIVEIGSGVEKDWMGKLVTVNPLVSCGHCRFCRTGRQNLCLKRKIIGISYPGAFAESMAVPVSACYPVTNMLTGTLIEPLACAVRATSLSRVGAGDNVLVFGAGTLGLMIAKLLRAKGASQCLVVDTNSQRLARAKEWGCTRAVNPSEEDVRVAVEQIAPDGMDCVIDAVGHQQTRNSSVSSACRGGRVVFIGLHENMTSLPGNEIVRNETEIVGSFAYSDDDFLRARTLVEGGFVGTVGGWLDVRSIELGQAAFLEQAVGLAPYSKIVLDPHPSNNLNQ
jgi:2-desacetyl-2-hydroxyethyl bacteriochlorophyllide A dehydrogenase